VDTFFGEDKEDKVVATAFQPLYHDPVAAGFSLRLFAQLKSCDYHKPFVQVKTCGYLYEI